MGDGARRGEVGEKGGRFAKRENGLAGGVCGGRGPAVDGVSDGSGGKVK